MEKKIQVKKQKKSRETFWNKFRRNPLFYREGGRRLADADQFSCILIVFLEKFQQCSLFRRYSQKRIAYFFYRYE